MAEADQQMEEKVLRFSKVEFDRRHREIRERMEIRGIDCLVIGASVPDVCYVSGVSGFSANVYIVFPLVGEPTLLAISTFGAARTEKECAIPVRVVSYKKGKPEGVRIRDFATDIVARVKELGFEKGTIGILSMRSIPAPVYLDIRKELPHADLVDAGDILLECRRIKSQEEIESLRKAGECADKGIEAIAEAARPGVTEAELTATCDYAMALAGAERGSFILLGSGPWSERQGAIGDSSQSQRKLQKGDIILNEIAPSYDGYSVQLCVPISIGGDVPEGFKNLMRIHNAMYELAFNELRPGTTVGATEKKVFELGVSLGGDFRRAWTLQTVEPGEAYFKLNFAKFKPGMAFVNHPWTEPSSGIGHEGHTIGNTLIVTENEPILTSRLPRELIIV